MVRLKEKYKDEVVQKLEQQFEYGNVNAIPKLVKITVNMGVGDAITNAKVLDSAGSQLAAITGQKAAVRRARKSIAAFKLREGMPVGLTTTLHGDRMWEFLDRLIAIALPRVRDFRGISGKSFDGRGNYTLGLKDQLIFPEINYAKVEQTRGMNVTMVTTAKTDEEAHFLLKELGMPFAG